MTMLLAGAIWLAWPLLRRKYPPTADSLAKQKEHEIRLTTSERTLAAIRDLDEDHLTGKLAQADYETERADQSQAGADAALDNAIEQAVASYIKSTQ